MRAAEHFALSPGLTFLNHGSFGACPRAVLESQQAMRARIESNPVTFLLDEGEALIDRSRAALSALLGANPEGVVFVTNATTGVNTIVRGLDLQAGDELLTIDHAYNACVNALRAAAEPAGAHVVLAEIPFPLGDPQQVVDAVLGAVTDRTRFVLLDHVTSATGLVLPVERLVGPLEARGISVMIDGAHAPGMLPLDLDRLGASYYTGNCHKWLCAPKGAGFLWVRDDLRARVRPLVVSHGRNLRRPGRSGFHDAFDWCGTFDPTAWLCVGEAIVFMDRTFGGWEAIRRENRALAIAGRALLCGALGIGPPAPESMIGSLASVPLSPSEDAPTGNRYMPDALQVRLRKRYGIEVPVMPWGSAGGRLLRISMQRYNDLDDVHALVSALRREGVA